MAGETNKRRFLTAGLLACLVLLAVGPAQGTAGALETSLNGTREVKTTFPPANDEAFALVQQPDGKLVAAGDSWNGSNYDFALARYKQNGSLDPSFGTGGKVTTAFRCVVPKVKGKRLRAAKKAIRQADCSVGKVKRAFSAKLKKGRVISQKPKPGAKRQPGSKVKLKVSKGKHKRR